MKSSEQPVCRVVGIDGHVIELPPAIDLPAGLAPGEFVLMPDNSGALRWYVYCNNTRFWDGSRWKVGGTLAQFDPGGMSEKELYAYRRKMLKWTGFI